MKTQLIVSSSCRIELLESDLIEFEITGKIDEIVARELVEGRKKIADGTFVKIIVTVSKLDLLGKETMSYFSTPEAEEGVIAVAVVQPQLSILQSAVNLYMSIKREVPTKLFNTREEALEWLSNY